MSCFFRAASTARSHAPLLHASSPPGGRPSRELSIAIPSSQARPASARGGPPVDPDIDPGIRCDACDAVCCRLTVVLLPGDDVPERLTAWTDEGLHVMARDEDGWCVAVDGARQCCSIYESRPAICRKFAMGGPYCRAVRAEYAAERTPDAPHAIPLVLC
ncbi:MAG: YkgJ family cysteine cluster protein [Lysobacter sp.]|nr:YkgJ family cysteine cluster protein [Lysobacter sp.]